MQLVEQPSEQILPNRRDAATESNVLAARSFARALERFVNAARHEVKRRIAFHRERLAHVVRQHEHLAVVRRLVAPPPSPAFVGPRAAHGTEHVAAQDPRADVREPTLRELVVDARRAALVAEHLAQRARAPGPVMQLHAADAERILHALVHAGAVAVEGNAETADAQPGHRRSLLLPDNSAPSLWLDERFEPPERVVPLCRHGLEIRPCAQDRLGAVSELTLPTDALGFDDA